MPPNLGTALSNYGLVTSGMNAEQEDENKLAIQKQQVETGKMGLEDVKRTRENSAAYRAAAAGAGDAGQIGAYHKVAEEALKRGDLTTADDFQKKSRAMQDEGFGNLSMAALTGKPTDQAEKEFNAMGVSRVLPGSLQYGRDPETGDILVKAKKLSDGTDLPPFNATQYARMHGIIKPTVHTIPAGGSLAVTEPGQPTRVVEGKTKTYAPSQGVIHVERAVDGEKKTYAYDMEKKDWIGGAPPGEAGAPPEAESGAGVRRNLPVLKAVDEAVSKIPGAVNKMDLSDPLHPYYEWTPKGAAYASRAQRLYLANPKLPPEVIREIVAAPELQARIVNGEEAELRYKGKTYKLGEATAVASAPAAAPSAAPAAAPATPQAAPAPTQTAVASTPPAAPSQPQPKAAPTKAEEPAPKATPAKADEEKLPDVVEVTNGATPKGRHESRVAGERARQESERVKQEKTKAEVKVQKTIETFRSIVQSPTMTREDAPLIEEAIATGKLSQNEELKAHRMLAKLRPTTAGRE